MERPKHTHDFEPMPESLKAAISLGRQLQMQGDWKGSEVFFTNLISEIRTSKLPGVTSSYIENGFERHALNERGLAFRMQNMTDPDAYTKAEADFTEALGLSLEFDDPDSTILALGGLIDVARTGDRGGPNYKRGKDINQAEAWKKEAQRIIETMPEGQPRVSIVATLIQFGLLEQETGAYLDALKSYNEAEWHCQRLLDMNPDDAYLQNRMSRIQNIRGVTQETLGQTEDAFAAQIESFNQYSRLRDVRGKANAAMCLAEMAEAKGDIEDARKWAMEMLLASEKRENGKIIVIDPTNNQMADDILGRLASK